MFLLHQLAIDGDGLVVGRHRLLQPPQVRERDAPVHDGYSQMVTLARDTRRPLGQNEDDQRRAELALLPFRVSSTQEYPRDPREIQGVRDGASQIVPQLLAMFLL